jgi:hypothetical protein
MANVVRMTGGKIARALISKGRPHRNGISRRRCVPRFDKHLVPRDREFDVLPWEDMARRAVAPDQVGQETVYVPCPRRLERIKENSLYPGHVVGGPGIIIGHVDLDLISSLGDYEGDFCWILQVQLLRTRSSEEHTAHIGHVAATLLFRLRREV